jgi:hypothetical protein
VREVAADAEVIWTDLRIDEMASAFDTSMSDRPRRLRARRNNPQVAGRYSWDQTAVRLHRLLDELSNGPTRSDESRRRATSR